MIENKHKNCSKNSESFVICFVYLLVLNNWQMGFLTGLMSQNRHTHTHTYTEFR